jgi:YbbR domain-containing protein
MIAFLRHLILHDFWLKLFSLGLAVLIWFTVHFASQREVSPVTFSANERKFPNLPVMVVFAAEDVRTFKVNPSQVDVTVQGDAKLLKNLQGKDFRVMVDLTGIEAAHLRKRVEVTPPPGVVHAHATPGEVEVIITPKT